MRILLIEDDERIAQNIAHMAREEGYAVTVCHTANDGLERAETDPFDLIILDWMLPDGDGIEICKTLRKERIACPILMLTARSQVEDRVAGLETGADDYLTKPFAMKELLARAKALIRRTTPTAPTPILTIGDLIIDTNAHVVKRGSLPIQLAPREYALLEYFARNAGRALTRLEIMEHVWGDEIDEFSNTVDVHIRYLRRKIDEGHGVKLIQTVKGVGYMLCQP